MKLDGFGVFVKDMPTMVRFYSDVLGFASVVSKGATPVLEPTTEPWGQRSCYVADPEGNLVEIGAFVNPGRSEEKKCPTTRIWMRWCERRWKRTGCFERRCSAEPAISWAATW
jgi:hypothetical protein